MIATAPNSPARSRNRGNVLFVVVVLLLLGSLFVLIGVNVGRFEQQTSGNDLRAKIVHEVAESGLSQGIEFFNARRDILSDPDNWSLCGASETAFPCGAVAETGVGGVARRATMFRFSPTNGGASFTDRLLTLPVTLGNVGGFATQQQVSAVLCRISAVPGAATTCATTDADASSTWVITVVSRGELPDEGSSTTLSQTVGAYNIFSFNPNMPPVIASGSVSVGGNLQIVTAPNAAGSDIPVSVWTRLEVAKNGTPNTCYLNDFINQGGTSTGPSYYDGIEICHTCSCPGDKSMSFPKAGNQACQGEDIVSIDRNLPVGVAGTNDCDIAPNLHIRREEFPKDLFAFVFGQKGWDDVDRGGIAPGAECTSAALDCHFAEARRISVCTYPHPATGAVTSAVLPEDTCYLLNIKNKIHIGDGINDEAECAALGKASSGVVWVHSQPIADLPGYDCSNHITKAEIGTPSKPVALIHDGSLTQVNGMVLYGLLFIREPNGSTTLDPGTGGSANFGINGTANVYGAVVVQGQIVSGGGGTGAIVFNGDILMNIINDPGNFSPSSLPGSWTDRLRY
jgi:Tfp pilus assembly protein PilX